MYSTLPAMKHAQRFCFDEYQQTGKLLLSFIHRAIRMEDDGYMR